MQMQPNDSLIPKDQDIIVRVQRPTYAFATSQVARCGLQLASAEIAERAGSAARCHGGDGPGASQAVCDWPSQGWTVQILSSLLLVYHLHPNAVSNCCGIAPLFR